MAAAKTVSAYIAAQPSARRGLLKRVRGIIRKAAPEAEEAISYQMPGYKLNGRVLIYFAGWKEHYALYPVLDAAKAFKKEMGGYKVSKGTVRFPYGAPVPAKLIERIVKFRAKKIAAAVTAKKTKAKKR